jgi:hypothetical protein
MLRNAAYCGYVSGLRDISKAIKGLHEPIVPEDLFDRVQERRAYRATVKQPSLPSNEYLLRKMLRCERCGARMHGTGRAHPSGAICAPVAVTGSGATSRLPGPSR